jgi:hypothetical protein
MQKHARIINKHHRLFWSVKYRSEIIKHRLFSIRQFHRRITVTHLTTEKYTTSLAQDLAIGKHLLPLADHFVKTTLLNRNTFAGSVSYFMSEQIKHLVIYKQHKQPFKLRLYIIAHKRRLRGSRLIKFINRTGRRVMLATIKCIQSRYAKRPTGKFTNKSFGKTCLTRAVGSDNYEAAPLGVY